MVIAQNMEHTVNGQIGQFPFNGVAVFVSLFLHLIERNDDISQKCRIRAIVAVFFPFVEGKGQDVCRPVYIAVLLVQFVDIFVMTEENADFRIGTEAIDQGCFLADPFDDFFIFFLFVSFVAVVNVDLHLSSSL